MERGWQEAAGCQEQLMAQSADAILSALLGECAEELGGIIESRRLR